MKYQISLHRFLQSKLLFPILVLVILGFGGCDYFNLNPDLPQEQDGADLPQDKCDTGTDCVQANGAAQPGCEWTCQDKKCIEVGTCIQEPIDAGIGQDEEQTVPETDEIEIDEPEAVAISGYHESKLIAPATEKTAGVFFGDLNRDGNLDIVLHKGRHWPENNHILFGDGQGGHLNSYTLPYPADRSYEGAVADLDLDGHLDLVICNDMPDNKLTLLNNGMGEFKATTPFGNPNWATRNCTAADVNRDGAPDIIVANRSQSPGSSTVCFNTKVHNSWGNFPSKDCLEFSSVPSTAIGVGDFNADDWPDLVAPHRNGGQSYLYWGPDFVDKTAWGPSNATIRIVKVADFDGDGKPDLATAEETNGVALYKGLGNGKFNRIPLAGLPSSNAYALQTGDLNGDSRPDITIGYQGANPVVLLNQKSPVFPDWKKINFSDGRGSVYSIAIGDYNSDGIVDIALGRSDGESRVFFGSVQ